MTIAEITTGSVVTRGNGSFRITGFYRGSPTDDEQPLHIAERDSKCKITTIGQPTIIQSGLTRTGNVWSIKRYEFPDNCYIKFVFTTSNPRKTVMQQQCNLMIRPRANAALYRLAITLPKDENSKMDKAYIEGRFDVLTPDEIKTLGLHRNAAGMNELSSFDMDDVGDFMTMHLMEKAIAPFETKKVAIVRSEATGETKGILKIKRKRNIRAIR